MNPTARRVRVDILVRRRGMERYPAHCEKGFRLIVRHEIGSAKMRNSEAGDHLWGALREDHLL